ncbi:MAG: hypothetical protein U0271_15855 [Polyangiaceae bacterium]
MSAGQSPSGGVVATDDEATSGASLAEGAALALTLWDALAVLSAREVRVASEEPQPDKTRANCRLKVP